MRIAILGAGAMGMLFATHLHRCEEEVYLVNRKGTNSQTIKENGISVEWPNGRKEHLRIPIYTESHQLPRADVVFVFVKGYATTNAMKLLIPAIDEQTIVVSLQNGMGNEQKIRAAITGSTRVAVGTTVCASTRLSAGHIRINHIGETHIGYPETPPDEGLKGVAELLSGCGIPTSCEANIRRRLWEKLFSNLAINPLTAILDVPNGQVAEKESCKRLLKILIDEAVKVAESEGESFNRDTVINYVLTVASKTAGNISSMLQDIRNGRKTEIDSINGWIVTKGKEHGIPTPANEIITLLIKAKGDKRC